MDRNGCGIDRAGRVRLARGHLVVGYRTRQRTPETLAFVAGSDHLATAVIQRCTVNALLRVDTCDTAP